MLAPLLRKCPFMVLANGIKCEPEMLYLLEQSRVADKSRPLESVEHGLWECASLCKDGRANLSRFKVVCSYDLSKLLKFLS